MPIWCWERDEQKESQPARSIRCLKVDFIDSELSRIKDDGDG